MTALFSTLSFVLPAALFALFSLPLVWWLLRATPPRPQTVRFPPFRLLLELVNRETEAHKTPWWLLLLRLTLVTLLIVGIARPIVNGGHMIGSSQAPLLLVVDNDWAAARNWQQRRTALDRILDEAAAQNRTVALALTSPAATETDIVALDAATMRQRISALAPQAITADRLALLPRLQKAFGQAGELHIMWLSNGLNQTEATPFLDGLKKLAGGNTSLAIMLPDAASLPLSLTAPKLEHGLLNFTAQRSTGSLADGDNSASTQSAPRTLRALAGNGRSLGEAALSFAPGAFTATTSLDLPTELRNQIQRVVIADEQNAAATFVMDDRWRRKTVALQAAGTIEQAQPLLSPLYYASKSLSPVAEVTTPQTLQDVADQIKSGLSLLVMADVATIPDGERQLLLPWIEQGGILLRFAGPHLAATQAGNDPLLPVKLRQGGRELGSALSWEKPQPIQPFAENTPFSGLATDAYVTISRQVLAEPDSSLSEKVWASLADGTPLVTARKQGKGLVILFHTTANADWSNLALAGLFADMLQRVVDLAPAIGTPETTRNANPGNVFYKPYLRLTGTGELAAPAAEQNPIPQAEMDKAIATSATPPGLYLRDASERAINVQVSPATMAAITTLGDGVESLSFLPPPRLDLAPVLFTAALLLLMLDTLVSLVLQGAWQSLSHGKIKTSVTTTLSIIFLALVLPALYATTTAHAQTANALQSPAQLNFAMQATEALHLAYVTTGDSAVDETSKAGLQGLSTLLENRTSVHAKAPMAIDIEQDEIAFFPLLYWPITDNAKQPSPQALEKMNRFMKNGGTLFFDLRDGSSDFDATATSTQGLQRILGQLDIPALEPVPSKHVLTKSFYLLKSFPGRYAEGPLWVQKADPNATTTLDGVSAIMIGSNDYAAAWAMDANEQPLNAVVPGGEAQREMAYRTGVNIVMYALTGNYKADQIHAKTLIERLGR